MRKAALLCALAWLAIACGEELGEPIDHEAPGEVHAVDAHGRTRRPVDASRHPFARNIAKLVIDSSLREAISKSCTATLLPGERHLLTARHCLYESADTTEAGANAIRMHGSYTIVFGYEHVGWAAHHALVIRGDDLFANGAVLELREHDVALVPLPEEFTTGGLRMPEHRLELSSPRRARLAEEIGELRGIPLSQAGAGRDGASRVISAGLFAYAADREIGLDGRVLTVDRGCEQALRAEAAAAPQAIFVECRGYPSGSGAPFIQETAGGGIFVAGIAIEAEHVSRRARMVPVAAFRAAVEAALR